MRRRVGVEDAKTLGGGVGPLFQVKSASTDDFDAPWANENNAFQRPQAPPVISLSRSCQALLDGGRRGRVCSEV